jgi:hypothetical protein
MDDAQRICPKCGWARESGAVECPACGIVYARFDNPPKPRTEASVNPYAPPSSDLRGQVFTQPGSGGVWRTGDLLVLQKGAVLPDRCLVCNAPAAVQWPRKLYWHPPGLYFLILLNLLIYAIAALVVRKKAELVIPLCGEHDRKRRRSISLSWLIGLGGLVVTVGSFFLIETSEALFATLFVVGLAGVFGSLALSTTGNPVLPKKIDDYYVWLKKVHSSYLAALPPAPPGL